MFTRIFRLPALTHVLRVGTLALAGATGAFAQSEIELSPIAESRLAATHSRSLLDQLPEYLVNRLPIFAPDGAVQVSVHPHLGDFFHSGYVRVPLGIRWKVTPRFQLNTELNNYFSKGDSAATGSGVSGMTLGAKCEHVLPALSEGGFSVGLDYRMPFDGTPKIFTDGYRHVQPYVAATRLLVPQWGLIGYGNLGANFFQHTSFPSNFGRNQLHANSLAFIVGVARNWDRFQASLTARLASTALTSDEGRQNFQLRPEIGFPLRSGEARTQILLTLGGRVMWGPDGRQVNTNGGVRINVHLDREHRSPTDAHFAM